jgi:hypothetical protein
MVTTALTSTSYVNAKPKQHLIFISLMMLVLSLLPNTNEADVQAFLNQDTAYIDDSVTFTIETNGKTNDNPDLSPLKKDFNILNTSNRSHMSNINGKTAFKKSWVVQLQPLHQGKITIPAITLGNEKTLELTLTVNDAPLEVAAATKEHVFVEASVALKNDKPPYVQQQISYTVKLFYDEQLLEYEIYPPTLENAVIEQLQQKEKYRLSRNGKNYRVIERNYVISAEKSGKLTIPPTIVKGNIRAEKKPKQPQQHQQNHFFQNDPFFNDPFGSGIFSGSIFGERGKAITLRSKPIEIEVQPLPTAFKGDNWLPAEAVVLNDSWQKKRPIFRVGEPVTRTLIIEAKGLASSQIPKLVLPQIDTIRAYPDQEDNKNYTDGATLIGVNTQTISYIPNQEGTLQLPEITLDWWNIDTKQQETARLPAITITIEAGAGVTKSTTKALSSQDKQQKTNHTDASMTQETTPENNSSFLFIVGILASFIGLGFVLFKNKTLLLTQYRHKYQQLRNWQQHKQTNPSQKNLLKHIQHACEQHDAEQAAHYLLPWAQQQWFEDKPQNLGKLADQLAVGSNVIRQLSQSLYAENEAGWKGDQLLRLVNTGLQKKQQKEKLDNDGLNTLYPMR